MRHNCYVGLIHKDASSDFGVSFPDFPGCVAVGSTLEETRAAAEEALAFHVEGMIEDGDPIPEPSPLDTIMADLTNRDGVATLVPLRLQAAKAVRVNVTLPEDVLNQIDDFAERHGYTRSGLLAQAAKRMIAAA